MKISKPVLRWVIGNCHELGVETLFFSIKNIKKIYQNNFYYCICFNSKNISKTLKKCFEEVDLILNQHDFFQSLSYNPYRKRGPHWKLYPPRICDDQHEIILDNDVVIYEKIKEIDDFLFNKDMFVVTKAIERSYSEKYDKEIKKGFNINTGLVGLPPNFDYKEKINNLLKKTKGEWQNHFDEQTLVANILQHQKTILIPFETLSACCGRTHFNIGKKGTHFVGINKGYDKWWKEYKIKNL